jgi:hypothetical protein
MSRQRKALLAVAIAAPWLVVGCGGGDETAAVGSTSTAVESTTADATVGVTGPRPEAAQLPPLLEPAPALECTGSTVLCVDATAGGSAPSGAAEQLFTTVTAAVAVAGPGAVIQVAAGEYEESLQLDSVSDLRLVGGFPSGGDFSSRDPEANETVLRGDAENAVINITASTKIHVEGFRLTGGGGYDDGYGIEGGGVFINNESSEISIIANRIDGNAIDHGSDPSETRGGGISSTGTDVEIIGNVIQDNRGGRGAGIAAVGTTTLIDGNTVVDNYGVGDHGGGMWLAGELTVTRNHVEGNIIGVDIGYGWGGGIIVFNEGSVATLRGNVVTGNLAPSYGSGVFIDDGARAALVGELYYANQCSYEGGAGLFVDSGGPTATVADLDHVTIAEHDCPEASQGGNAIYASRNPGDPRPIVTVSNSILYGNAGSDVLSLDAEIRITSTLTEEEGIEGDGNITGDPMFTEPAAGDFTLRSSSPAIGAGTDGIDLGHTGAAP